MRLRVPLVRVIFNTHTFLSAYLQSLDSPEQLCALAGKHRTNYQFDSSSLLLLSQLLQVQLILTALIVARA